MNQFIPGSASEATSEIELTLSCRNLLDMDVFSKSDPMVVTYMKSNGQMEWKEIHRTEMITNNLNPDFASKINLKYIFEEQQFLKFSVYDIDIENYNLEDQDFLGGCETTLGQIVSSGKLTLPLLGVQNNKGQLIVMVEELASSKDEVILKFSGRNLDRKDWFGTSDPFLEIHKVCEDGEYRLVHRTEVKKWNLNPIWKEFTLSTRSLCGGDGDRSLMLRCWDWNRSGRHSLIGQVYTTLNQLSVGPGADNVMPLANPSKQKKPGYKNSGEIILDYFKMNKVYSFLDYIINGTQIHCTIAIDFTGSNGDPRQSDSLHYISETVPNQYQQALSSVGDIIQDYDSNKMFPVLGFGARIPPDGRVSHEFFVNFHPDNPYCNGIQGVLDAYKSCIRKIQLYGPTNFSPVIRHVSQFARTYNDGSQYFILLIITDGIITDMPQTKQAIIDASVLPLSIIIVGVGEADFSAMNELDADTVPLIMNGRQAARDIVQFVPLRHFQGRNVPVHLIKARLAKEVLAEVPDQLVGFMKSQGIKPKGMAAQ